MSAEQQLTELFDEQARQAPAPDALLDGALRKVRTRRRRLAAVVGGTAVLGAAVVLAAGLNLSSPGVPVASPSPSGTVPAGREGQPLDAAVLTASCAYGYEPDVIAEKLDFAFDGTVVSIGAPVSERPGDPQPWDYVGVTFRVNEWFKGGSGYSFSLDMVAPGIRSRDALGYAYGSPSSYAPGTRLLVSGTARWGGGDPLAYPVAWFGCGGFTRYYSDQVANSWRAANS